MTKPRGKFRSSMAARVFSLALCLLFLAGCAREDGITWSSVYNTPEPASPLIDGETRAGNGILRVSMPAESGSWDPAVNNSRSMQALMQLCYETPVRLDDTQKPREHLVSWVPSADGIHWTFTLRSGVSFSDGTPLTAADIVKSLDRILTVGAEGPYGWILDELAAWSIADETTLNITAAHAGYDMLYAMVFPVMKVRDEGYPIGTGPYRLAFYEVGSVLELETQAHWWREAPHLTKVRAVARGAAAESSTPLGENNPEMAAFRLGETDLARTRSITATQYRESGVSATYSYMTQGYDALFFHFGRPMMADPNIRAAIAHAIDRQDLIVNIYQGHAIAADVPIPPDTWLHDLRLTGLSYDVALARKALEDAGFVDVDGDGVYDVKPPRFRAQTDADVAVATPADIEEEDPQIPSGPADQEVRDLLVSLLTGGATYNPALLGPLRLLTNYDKDNPVRRDAALRIANQLQSAGLPVEVVAVTLDELPQMLEEGDYDIALLGYQIPYSCDLRFLLSGQYEGEQAGKLVTHFSDAQIEYRLDAVGTARDDAAYKAAVFSVGSRILDELPFVGLYFRTDTLAARESLKIPVAIREDKSYYGIETWYFVEEAEE